MKFHYPCSTIYGSKIIMKPIHNQDDIKIKHVQFYQINKSNSLGKHHRTFPIDSLWNYRVTYYGANRKAFNQNIVKYIKLPNYQRCHKKKIITSVKQSININKKKIICNIPTRKLGELSCSPLAVSIEMVPFWSFRTRTTWLSLDILLTFDCHISTIFHHKATLSTATTTISPNKTYNHMFLTTLTTSLSSFW